MSDDTQHLYSRGPFPSYFLLPPRPIEGEDIRALWCLVDGDTVPFEVRAATSFRVDYLKEVIKQRQVLRDIPDSSLVLWKLKDPEPVNPEDNLVERIRNKGDVTKFATKLSVTEKVSKLFPQPPLEEHVNILVQLPSKTPFWTVHSRRPFNFLFSASNVYLAAVRIYHHLSLLAALLTLDGPLYSPLSTSPFRKHPYSSPAEGGDHEAKRKWTALNEAIQILPSDHPLHELWKRTREPQPTFFEIRTVQRDDNPTRTELPSSFAVLKGGQWTTELQPDSSMTDVMIRDEYKEALRAIMEWFLNETMVTEDTMEVDDIHSSLKNPFLDVPDGFVSETWAFVLLGHPGIGKTVFLYVLLVLRLQARLPTIYQSRETHLYYFDDKGVSQIDPQGRVARDFKSQFDPSTWCLIDSNATLNTVPIFIQDLRLFIVQASSPRPYRFDWMKKATRPVLRYFMKTWTPSELLVGRGLQRKRCTEEQIEYFSEHYGTSARSVYTYATNPSAYETRLRQNLGQLSYKELGQTLVQTSGLDLSGPISHQIILISPGTSRDAFQFSFPSHHIYEILRNSLSARKLLSIALLYEIFVRVPNARSASGPMLEDAVNDVFPRGGEWGLVSMQRSPFTGPKNTHWKAPEDSTSSQYLQIGFEEHHIAINTNPNPVGTEYNALTPILFIRGAPLQLKDGYYLPLSREQATFDAFIYESASKTATVFQVTTSSKHSVKEEGIEWLFGLGVEQFRYIAVSPPNNPLDLPFPNKWGTLISEKYLLIVESLLTPEFTAYTS